MPWSVEKVGLALLIFIGRSMDGEWEALLAEIDANLDPLPAAIHLPSRFDGETDMDAEMLKLLWQRLQAKGIPLLPANNGK